MAHPLEKRIAEREANIRSIDEQIAALTAQRGRIEAELTAYRDSLQFVLPKVDRPKREARPRGRRAGVGDTWKEIIVTVAGRGERVFSTDDIMAYSDVMGYDFQRATVRAQCANLVKAGYLERVSEGHFTVTNLGCSAFGLDVSQIETAGESLGTQPPAALSATTNNGG